MPPIALPVQDCEGPFASSAARFAPKHRIRAFSVPRECGAHPSGVFSNHAEDKGSQLLAYAPSSHAGPMPRKPRPIQLEPCAMPANDGFRLHEDQCPFPSRPEPPQDHPEQFVGNGKSRLWPLLFQNAKLLTQRQVFQEEVAARTDRANEQDEQEPQRTRHEHFVAGPQEYRAVKLVKLPKEKPSAKLGCSRICSCQSTKEQQGSTGIGSYTLHRSLQSS